MNLAIVNENVNVINSLTIDIIKVMHGVYDAETLKDENLPLAKGLVVQKIKEVKNEKKAAKVIVKKNNIC